MGSQDGHWDDEGSDSRWDRDGNLLPITNDSESFSLESLYNNLSEITGLTGTALIIYIIISEGSRLIPVRNLVPIP